jgi:fructose-1,6-bisphosphatase/inositol monophosphatase family enzyme
MQLTVMTRPLTASDFDRVGEFLRTASREQVLPAFRHLEPGDVEQKPSDDDPEDVVSRVDRAVEAWLSPLLRKLLPGSLVVGEESAYADPDSMDALLSGGSVWVIDPIDGTRNFVRGDDGFGIMVALVVAGTTRAAWIQLPVEGALFCAEAGSGAWLDGTRVTVPALPAQTSPTGTLYTKFMSNSDRHALESLPGDAFQVVLGAGSAAVEYTNLVRGRKDFVVYQRLLPWDHLPGVLLLNEAGGRAALASGAELLPADRVGPLIAARNAELNARVRGWLHGNSGE